MTNFFFIHFEVVVVVVVVLWIVCISHLVYERVS